MGTPVIFPASYEAWQVLNPASLVVFQYIVTIERAPSYDDVIRECYGTGIPSENKE